MVSRLRTCLLLCILLVAPAVAPAEAASYSKEDVLDKVYSDYVVPEGFWYEHSYIRENVSFQVQFVHHWETVKSTSYSHFLCTDDRKEADWWAWIASPKEWGANWSFGFKRENEKFFEFWSQREAQRTEIISWRVHKCSYLEYEDSPPGWGPPEGNGIPMSVGGTLEVDIGRLNFSPLEPERVREALEFTWTLMYRRLHGTKVISTELRTGPSEVAFLVLQTSVSYAWRGHDEIKVVLSTYTVDLDSGNITLSLEVVDRILGQYHQIIMVGPEEYEDDAPDGEGVLDGDTGDQEFRPPDPGIEEGDVELGPGYHDLEHIMVWAVALWIMALWIALVKGLRKMR